MSEPMMPKPTTRTRSPSATPESQTAVTAVSMLLAKVARPGGRSSGRGRTSSERTTQRSWCGWSTWTFRPPQLRRPLDDLAHERIAVLDGERESPAHVGTPHLLPESDGDLSAGDQAFRARADGREHGPHDAPLRPRRDRAGSPVSGRPGPCPSARKPGPGSSPAPPGPAGRATVPTIIIPSSTGVKT